MCALKISFQLKLRTVIKTQIEKLIETVHQNTDKEIVSRSLNTKSFIPKIFIDSFMTNFTTSPKKLCL